MFLVVISKKDPASVNIRERLLELSKWDVKAEYKNLAEVPTAFKWKFINEDVADAAYQELERDDDLLLVWSRIYDDSEALETAKEEFTGPLAWRTRTNLAFGEGIVGLRRIFRVNDPLMIYLTQNNNTLIYITYYNQDGTYNATHMDEDKIFLIDLAKNIIQIE